MARLAARSIPWVMAAEIVETTKLYVTLSGRETAERVRVSLRQLDRRLACILEEAPC